MVELQEGRSESIFIVTLVFLVISLIAVSLRCFVRLHLVRAFGWDDALMVFAMILNILFALCGMIGSFYGLGQKFEGLTPSHIETALFWWWLGQTTYVITCVVAKISIALALLRLTVARIHKIILWAVVVVSTIIGLTFWFMLTLQCHPVAYFWHRFTMKGTCINTDYVLDIAYIYSVFACICDLILGLLPILLVWKLHMNFSTKAALAGILSMGCVASAAVIVRIPYLHYYKDPDFLYATTDISIWSNVEAGLGITAGSLVTLRPLFRWFRGTDYAHSQSKGGKRTTGSMPLSSMNGMNRNGTHLPQHGEAANRYWRPDLSNQDTHGITTMVQASRASQTSSQEGLNPEQGALDGVNVHKSFFVTSSEA